MNFLDNNGKLNLELIDAVDYSAFHGKFYEEIDPHLAKLMLDDKTTIKVPDMEYVKVDGNWIIQQKKNEENELIYLKDGNGDDLEQPRFTQESKKLLKKRLKFLKNKNKLEIIYHQKKLTLDVSILANHCL